MKYVVIKSIRYELLAYLLLLFRQEKIFMLLALVTYIAILTLRALLRVASR
jgi:hypothetical protein